MAIKETKGNNYRWWALLTVSMGCLLTSMDVSIVNISFPRLTGVFETDASAVLWVTVAYCLTFVGLMPVLGKVGDIYGRKKVFILGLVIFTIGMALCSLSRNMLQLILSRAVQGAGGAMCTALSFAIVTAAFSDEERGKAMGVLTSVVGMGTLLGPVIGGFLLDALDWRSIFYARVPIGIIGLLLTWALLKEQKTHNVSPYLDLWGAATLFSTISCFLLFINLGGRSGFITPPILILAGGSVILLALFIVQEIRTAQPIVDLNLFKDRVFTGSSISQVLLFAAMSTQAFLLSYYLIDGVGYSASKSGLFFAVPSFMILVVAPISGRLSDKVGTALLSAAGMALSCLGLFLLSGLGAGSSTADILLRLAVFGIGVGVFISPNASQIMGTVPKDKMGIASAVMNTLRQIGISSGIAFAGLIFTTRQSFHAGQLAGDNLDPLMLHRLSLIGGCQDTLLITAIVCSIGIFTSLVRVRKQSNR